MFSLDDDPILSDRLERLALLRDSWEVPEDPGVLWRRRVQAAWSNTAIEGNCLSWQQALELASGRAQPRSREDQEMLACLHAAEFLEELHEVWSLGLVRHLHALVMEDLCGSPGSLREKEVAIVKESGEGAGRAVFTPPHPLRVRELLEILLARYSRPVGDPFLAAGRFHYEFQSIHPFEDGNGRVGRLLSTSLARRGWDSMGFFLEPAIRRAGSAYYLALRAVRSDYSEAMEPQGLMSWLLPFLDMAEEAFTGHWLLEDEA